MSKIKIEDIQKEISAFNWKVLSTEYKNLNEEMVFECSEGHKVYSSWGKIRKKLICPVCEKNIYKYKENKVVQKKAKVRRILALDQATHITGWSIYDGNQLIKSGIFETRQENEIKRDLALKEWLINMIYLWQPDYIGLEDIQLQQFKKNNDNIIGVQTFKTLAHLQGILMATLQELNINYGLCPPATWRSHCKVKGTTKTDKKRSMQLLVKEWFDISVSNDEADAIGIGKYVSEILAKKNDIEIWE